MAQIFPPWWNRLPMIVAIVGTLAPALSVAGIWYFFSPWYTDVGYSPVQPVPYSHRLHVGDLGLDCRYCHASVETSPVANLPPQFPPRRASRPAGSRARHKTTPRRWGTVECA